MHDDPPANDCEEELLNAVLASYLEAVARNEQVDRCALVENHPELAEELTSFFAAHDDIARWVNTWHLSDLGGPEDMAIDEASAADSPVATNFGVLPRRRPHSFSGTRLLNDGQPQKFGDYEILEEIARGGMGIVYKARQISLNRIVAIKMILSGELAGEREIRRFQIEAEAAANLQHPNIVGIYGVGQEDGQYYYSMEYVAGASLSEVLRDGPLPCKQAADYVRQIALAIDYAHQHGVTHRDIKPSNVLIDDKGHARISDFGLAKRAEGSQNLTRSRQFVGTVPYMAPEQIAGSRDRAGPASDVYSLGALFYELLTGQPPFRAETVLDTLDQIREKDPKLPRQLNPSTPRELEMICLKCLEKRPESRYRSARELADDLERYLNGDAISISGPTLFDRLLRTLGRGHFDMEFRTWSSMLMHFAWIVLAGNCLIFLVGVLPLSPPLVWLAVFRIAEFVGMGLVLWLYRADWYPPQGKQARQLWSLWLAYVAGSLALIVVEYTMAGRSFDYLMLYPRLAILSSPGFLMIGSSYWGYCYGIGAGFLLLALILPLSLTFAPVLFGLAWAASLLALAHHLGKLADES
jgi:eukaryotic-like serine/threonine-protein kinase